MGVVVQFKIDGLDEGKRSLKEFNNGIKDMQDAANDANRRAFQPFNQRLEETGRKLQETGDKFVSVGKRLSLGLTAPIVGAGAALFKFASDAIESENLFNVAMGDMAANGRAFSNTLRNELGLNEFEMRKQIGTIFQMTESMGLSKDAAFSMATGMTQLTQDMASFFNLNPDEAFTKLTAGITGEVEPLKRLGIIVNETTIAQTAMTHGLIKQGEQMTESQKVMARYLTILDQTKNAQGDLGRTIDSPINQMRILTAEMKQQAIELGMALMPHFRNFINNVLKPAVTWIGNVIQAFKKLTPETQALIVKFIAFTAIIGPLVLAMGALLKVIGLALGATGIAGLIRFLSSTAFLAAIGNLGKFTLQIGALVAAFAAGVAAVQLFKNTLLSGDLQQGIEQTRQQFIEFFNTTKDTITNTLGDIKGSINEIFGGADGVGKAGEETASALENNFKNSLEAIENAFRETSDEAKLTFGEGAKAGIQDYIDKLSDIGTAARTFVASGFQSLQNTISQFIQTGKISFGGFINSMKAALADFLASQIVQKFASFLLGIGAGGASYGVTASVPGLAGASAAAGASGSGVVGFGSGLLSGKGLAASFNSAFGSTSLGNLFAAGASKLGLGTQATAALGNIGMALPAGLIGGFMGNLAFGGGTASNIGATIGGIAGALTPLGPFGSAIGSFIGSGIGSLFGDKDYPWARADIQVRNGQARLLNTHALDNGPMGMIRDMADAVISAFNDLTAAAGVVPGNMTASIGFSSGRPGSKLGKGFFAGAGGAFDTGATYTGLTDAGAAIAAALDYMSSHVDIPQFATGGERVFNQPTMIMVGERPERVSVSHLSSGHRRGDGINVVMQGPTILDNVSMNAFIRRIGRAMDANSARGI